MLIVDVNLLLYAVVSGFPQHARAARWWEDALNGPTAVGLAGPAIFGFLRLSTNPRVFTSPLSVEAAVGYVEQWLERPQVSFVLPGARHLEIAFGLLRSLGTGANLTTDVQLAALAVEHRGRLCSNDTDFGRFPGLAWFDPLSAN